MNATLAQRGWSRRVPGRMNRRTNLASAGTTEGRSRRAIVSTHAPVVLGQADVDQPGDVDVVAERLCAGHGEIIVLRAAAHVAGDADALPDEKQPDRRALSTRRKAGATAACCADATRPN